MAVTVCPEDVTDEPVNEVAEELVGNVVVDEITDKVELFDVAAELVVDVARGGDVTDGISDDVELFDVAGDVPHEIIDNVADDRVNEVAEELDVPGTITDTGSPAVANTRDCAVAAAVASTVVDVNIGAVLAL